MTADPSSDRSGLEAGVSAAIVRCVPPLDADHVSVEVDAAAVELSPSISVGLDVSGPPPVSW